MLNSSFLERSEKVMKNEPIVKGSSFLKSLSVPAKNENALKIR